jgi:rhodanese-related sulfurtransferase
LGLYVTAHEAYEKWRAAPATVKVLDVRTPEEYIFVGHPPMAVNVPLGFQTYRWDPAKGYFDLELNPDFVVLVRQLFEPGDEILAVCRSGGRSAVAANLLAKDGFTNVWNIIDGVEGDLVDDPESPHHGKRMRDGWKNSGAPWTYAVEPEQVLLPEDRRDKYRSGQDAGPQDTIRNDRSKEERR